MDRINIRYCRKQSAKETTIVLRSLTVCAAAIPFRPIYRCIRYRLGIRSAPCRRTDTTVAFSIDSKVKELRKSEAASDIIAAYTPGFKTDPQMKLVGALTFRKLCSFPQAGLSAEQLAEIDEKLKALG